MAKLCTRTCLIIDGTIEAVAARMIVRVTMTGLKAPLAHSSRGMLQHVGYTPKQNLPTFFRQSRCFRGLLSEDSSSPHLAKLSCVVTQQHDARSKRTERLRNGSNTTKCDLITALAQAHQLPPSRCSQTMPQQPHDPGRMQTLTPSVCVSGPLPSVPRYMLVVHP